MRIASALLSAIMIFELTCSYRSASAATVNYTPTATPGFGVVEGNVPVNKVGDLLLADAQVLLKGNVIDVEGVPQGSTEKKTVLSGVVFNAKVSGTGKSRKLTGYAYFRQGQSLTAIDDPQTEEMIDVEDGGVIGGHILAVNRERVEIQTPAGVREVSVEKIRRICSPRIFAFTMPVALGAPVATGEGFQGECNQIKFERTAKARRGTKEEIAQGRGSKLCCIGFVAAAGRAQAKVQQASQAASVGKIMAIAAAMVAVAAAVAIPIAVAVPIANSHKSHGPKPEEIAIYNMLTRRPAPPPPPPPPPPPSGP